MMYTPLYFLAALGAGGLTVSFFLMLMFWVPHPGQAIPVFSDWVMAFQTGSALMQAMIVIALSGVLFFVWQHVRLLILNFRMVRAFQQTEAYADFASGPLQTQELAMPLTLAMSINVGFVVGALFVPGLWSVVEYLFPLAMLGFLLIGIWALRLYARLFDHVSKGAFDLAGTASFAQVLPAFAFAMVSVGLAAPAAMSHVPWIVGASLVLSTFFALAAILIAVLKSAMGISQMLSKGIDENALPTLWIWVPILTVLAITMMRQDHGITHTLALAPAGDWLMPLVTVVSAQIMVLMLGAVAMRNHDYLPRVWRGELVNGSVFALICPGVALSVSLQFLINKGFVASGLVVKFGLGYWLLSSIALLVMLTTILVFFRLIRGLMRQRASLFSHGYALETR